MFRSLLLPATLLALLMGSASAQLTSYFITRRRSVSGNDIPCADKNGKMQTYCQVCGGVVAVAARCTARPDCRGFDMEDFDCGYLKTASNPGVQQKQVQSAAFCKGGASTFDTNGCYGEYQMWIGFKAAEGYDFKCGYKEQGIEQSECIVNGNHLSLMDQCDKFSECGAVVFNLKDAGKSGWLKRAGPSLRNATRADINFVYLYKKK